MTNHPPRHAGDSEGAEMVKHTEGPWFLPHFANDDHPCQCTSVVDGGYAGGICTIIVGNGLLIGDGGNDGPPLDEAKANARLIASAPDMLAELKKLRNAYVNLLEIGRDRILHLGGQCAPVDVMEAGDPWLRSAAETIARAEGRP